MTYKWRKNGVDIPGATLNTLTLNSAGAADSGGYSVIVRNATDLVGSDTAHLAVLTDGANDTKPEQIVAPSPLSQPTGVDSLVLVTHGWEPLQPFASVSWINEMVKAIQIKVPVNWKAAPFHWESVAAVPNPDLAIDEAVFP